MGIRRAVYVCSIAALLAVAPLGASAQIEAGDWRISAGIGGAGYSELDVEGIDVEATGAFLGSAGGVVQVGYAATETFEAGVSLGFAYDDIEIDVAGGSTDATSVFAGPYVALNIPVNDTGSVVVSPVFSAGYSGQFSDAIDVNLFEAEIGAELKMFVAKDASIDLGFFVGYEVGEAEVSGLSGEIDAEGFSVGPRIKISIWP